MSDPQRYPAGELRALGVDRLLPAQLCRQRLGEFVANVRASGEPGQVLVPGEPEIARRRRAEEEGIAVPADVMEALEALRGS